MSPGTNRTLTVSTANVRDRYNPGNAANCEAAGVGNLLTGTNSMTFNVGSASDTTPPTVVSVTPGDGSTSVSTSIQPSLTFNEEIDPRTVRPTSIFLMNRQGTLVPSRLALSLDAKTVTIVPTEDLPNPGHYYIVATTAIRDLGGGNPYDGEGGELESIPGILRTCFSTSAASCP